VDGPYVLSLHATHRAEPRELVILETNSKDLTHVDMTTPVFFVGKWEGCSTVRLRTPLIGLGMVALVDTTGGYIV
jgi:hypothetical protein